MVQRENRRNACRSELLQGLYQLIAARVAPFIISGDSLNILVRKTNNNRKKMGCFLQADA